MQYSCTYLVCWFKPVDLIILIVKSHKNQNIICRTIGWKSEDNSHLSHGSICCFSVFPSHFDSYVTPACDFSVAVDHYWNGANIFLSRTRIVHWYRGMEVRNHQDIRNNLIHAFVNNTYNFFIVAVQWS